MNQAIADIIKEKIEKLPFVDKIAGLVQTVHLDFVDEKGGRVAKAFPVACCVTADDCKKGAYNDLAPDSKYKTVIYFEDEGVSFLRESGNHKHYRSTLRLVCWINVAKLKDVYCKKRIPCTVSAQLIAQIIRALPRNPENISPFDAIYINVTEQLVRSNSIFTKYSYNEKQTQYLLSPYDFFALEIVTDFAICLTGSDVYYDCHDSGDS